MNDHTTHETAKEIPYGYCHCGCGQKTRLATTNNARLGIVKGQPRKFKFGHGGAAGVSRPTICPPVERFWQKVDRSGGPDACWLWLGSLDKRGYGQFSIGHKKIFAHRYSYELHKGPIPEGENVCHSCDRPACTNPAHLWSGTQHENLVDSVNKGRFHVPDGRGYRGTKYTDDEIVCFRTDFAASGLSIMKFAKRRGVNPGNMWKIIRRLSYKHVSP